MTQSERPASDDAIRAARDEVDEPGVARADHPSPGIDIAPGSILGSYRVLSELGRGGNGVVYRAEDLKRGGTVALKTLLWGDPAEVLRFKQEFRTIADIMHRNLATLYELASDNGRLFFSMELVEGVTFSEWLRADARRIRPAFAQLANGLQALHGAGRIHRDLKPSNVLVSRDGRVVILDFGLAVALGREGAHQTTLSRAKGTPAYMAPEQALSRPVTAACDWYSVGVLLYEAITGRLPFEGSGLEVVIAKVESTPATPSELGVLVPEDLESLCMSLLDRDAERRPVAAEVLERLQAGDGYLAPTTSAPAQTAHALHAIVGRDGHLRAMLDAFQELRKRRPVMVLVHGNSGMGKTTLLQSLRGELGSRERVLVLHGKCYERESVPYKALDGPIDLLVQYLASLTRADAAALLPRDVHSIARVFPVLRRVEVIAQAPPPLVEIPDPQELRRRAFAGMREVFARISDRGPLVLCVDDLQWGDADSADLLIHLLRGPEAPPFLFIGCYRREDEEASAFIRSIRQRGRGLPDAKEIRVDPLSADDARALAESLLAEVGVSADRAAAVALESGGSPFFLHELAAHGHDLSGEAGVTLEDVLRLRIQSLPEVARALLEVVAVAGRPVPLSTAAFAAQLPDGAQSSTLAALCSVRLARLTSSGSGESLDAYHDRVRETVLNGLAAARLSGLHRRLGHALEAGSDVDPEVLALHFEGAGDSARAGWHYSRAAENAHQALAFDHAARLYGKTLELLNPDGEKRRELLRHLADALADAGRGAEAGAVYCEAAEGADGAESLELRSRAAHQFLATGHLGEWRRIIGPVQRELGIRGGHSPARTLVRIVRDLAWLRLRGFRYRKRDPASQPRDAVLQLEICDSIASGLSQIDFVRGLLYHTLTVRRALKLGHAHYVALAIPRQITFETAANIISERRFERLRKVAERCVAEAGEPIADAYLDLCFASVNFIRGEWSAALEPAARAAKRIREECVGHWWERDLAELYRLMSLDFLGEFRELVVQGDEHLRDAEDRGSVYMATDLRTRIIYLRELLGDAPGQAQEVLDDALANWPSEIWDLQHYRWLEGRMNVALYRGDVAGARGLLDETWAPLRRSLLLRIPLIWHVFAFGRERIALLEAEADTGGDRARSLRAKSARTGRRLLSTRRPYAAGWGRLLLAGASNMSGDADAAVRHLTAAESAFTEAKMSAYAAVARRCRGLLDGGAAGQELVAASDRWLSAQGVADPAAWSRMYAPGFQRPAGRGAGSAPGA